MIAVSIQFSNCFTPPLHFALPPLPTDDFKIAKTFAMDYMSKHYPGAVNINIHMMRHDWAYENELMENQESNSFSLN